MKNLICLIPVDLSTKFFDLYTLSLQKSPAVLAQAEHLQHILSYWKYFFFICFQREHTASQTNEKLIH